MILYLIKSGACLAAFLIFYKLLLENERMHNFKRYYLLVTLIIAFVIPLITFVEHIEVPLSPISYETPAYLPTETTASSALEEPPVFNWLSVLWLIYVLGVLFFLLRFLKNLLGIARNIRNNPKRRINKLINVLLQTATVPHTFFNYIFLDRRKLEANAIPNEVLVHEAAHAKQKHSLDILFVELLQIIFWFNPLVFITKHAIKLNHEFLADQAVLNHGTDTPQYQNILLAFASSAGHKDSQSSMVNRINYTSYLSIKKRFTVMKTQTSKKSVVFRSILFLPLLALLLYGFSERVIIPKESSYLESIQEGANAEQIGKFNTLAKKYNAVPPAKRIIPYGDLKTLETIYRKFSEQQKNEAQPFPECPDQKSAIQEGATEKQVAEYNAIAKSYNAMLAKGGSFRIKKSDVDRLEYLHGIMTEEQRANAEPFPDFPEPPEPPEPPAPPSAPSPPNKSEKEVANEIIQEIIANQDPYDNINNILPSSPRVNETFISVPYNQEREQIIERETPREIVKEEQIEKAVEVKEIIEVPPAPPRPPKPKSPLEHIKAMAKKDARFYYEGKEISSKKAIEMLKKCDQINVESEREEGKRPVVKLSAESN